MKSLIIGLLIIASQSVMALDDVKNFKFEKGDITLLGQQRISTFYSFLAEKTGTKNYAFETSIQKIILRGEKVENLTTVVLENDQVVTNNNTAVLTFTTNFSAINEKITLSCLVDGSVCELSYKSPKKGDYDGGLAGSGRTNAHEQSSLEEAIVFAKQFTLVMDNPLNASTDKDVITLKFDREPIEVVLSDAGVCENVFHSGGGVYGPGNNICFTEIVL